jgi:hypothetical protein
LSVTAVSANALVIIRNATTKDATDFHIEFYGPADKVQLSTKSFTNLATYPSPSPFQNQVDFSGGGVKNGQEMTLNGLSIAKGGKALEVKDWWFTTGNNERLTGAPLVFIGNGKYNDLLGLTLDGFSIRAVPEPATWALMILGFGGVGAVLRRRRALAA